MPVSAAQQNSMHLPGGNTIGSVSRSNLGSCVRVIYSFDLVSTFWLQSSRAIALLFR